ILGLLKKQAGEINIFGKRLESDRIEILREIGSLIESPSIYGHLTAAENLRVFQTVYQSPASRTNEVLELVGLGETGKKKAGHFSLGMKQRLSIAIALLHKPRLLILDEPTNGLDPEGILEMRDMLKRLKQDEGITILISSHLLSEIEKLVDDVGIIHKGRILFQGTLSELQSRQRASSLVAFRTSDNAKAAAVFMERQVNIVSQNGRIATSGLDEEAVALLNKELVMCGVDVYAIERIEDDLERIFLDVIKS
ncbi:MAG TPA: ATP-binding cassette domain-containing protein, partial [Pyrinomonadaceae bacterium]|nr:ATP-binding cassette domain-containing protein [Pyrinomonadaceae bacterium]